MDQIPTHTQSGPSATTPVQEPPILSWEAPTRPEFERSKRWYIISGSFLGIAAIYGLFSGGWTLTLVCALIAAMYYLLHNHTLPLGTAVITKDGIGIGQSSYAWGDLEGFWLLETPEYTELHIVPKGTWRADRVIQTGAISKDVIKEMLTQFTTELTGKQERFIDTFIRICKL